MANQGFQTYSQIHSIHCDPPTFEEPIWSKGFRVELSTVKLLEALRTSRHLRRKNGLFNCRQVFLEAKDHRLRFVSHGGPIIECSAEFEAAIHGRPNPLVMDGESLENAVRLAKGPRIRLEMSEDGETVQVISDHRILAELAQQEPGLHPNYARKGPSNYEVTMHSDHLSDALRKTRFVSNYKGKRQCRMEFGESKLKVVATDGYRLAITEVPCFANKPFAANLPEAALHACRAMKGEISIQGHGSNLGDLVLLVFSGKDTRVTTRIFEDFPDYTKASFQAKQTVDFWLPDLRNAFLEAEKHAKLAEAYSVRIDLTTSQRTIRISTAEGDIQVPYACATNGTSDEGFFYINPRWIAEVLKKSPRKGKIRLSFTGTQKPIRFQCLSSPYEVSISPVRPPES